MKNLITLYVLFISVCPCMGQTATDTWSVKFSDAIISRWPSTINSMTNKGWEYSNTIITHGIEKVYTREPKTAYLTYIRNYVNTYVNTSGSISASMVSLDRMHPGISCLFLYEQLKSNSADSLRYRNAATSIRNILVGPSATYTKTSNGIFWHKLSGYNNIVMLDGIYMAHPFLAKYGSLFGDNAAIDTAVNQTLFLYGQLYDPVTHLIKHAWTSTPASYPSWAHPVTGNSSEVWSRAMGWYMMALVDILKYVPASHPKRSSLLTALNNLATGIKDYQDTGNGLWYQVVDKGPGHAGYTAANYVESSGSAMFVYALKTAVDSGWLDPAVYLPVAQNGWSALKTTKISIYSGDGQPQINDFAPAMSYQNNYNGYVGITPVDCPTTVHPHGYAAILMAASAMEFPLSILPVRFTAFSGKESNGNILLKWENADDTQVDYYTIHKSTDGSHFTTAVKMISNYTGSYSWLDTDAAGLPVVFYRVTANSKDGTLVRTNIIAIKSTALKSALTITPNPAKGGVVNFGVKQLAPGRYNLKIINAAGTEMQLKSYAVGSEKFIYETIVLPPWVGRGLYIIKFEGVGMNLYRSVLLTN